MRLGSTWRCGEVLKQRDAPVTAGYIPVVQAGALPVAVSAGGPVIAAVPVEAKTRAANMAFVRVANLSKLYG